MNPQVGDVVCEIELEQFSVGVKVETSGYIAEICEFLCDATKVLAHPYFSTDHRAVKSARSLPCSDYSRFRSEARRLSSASPLGQIIRFAGSNPSVGVD